MQISRFSAGLFGAVSSVAMSGGIQFAQAADGAVELQLGTTGVALQASTPIAPRVNLRGGVNYFNDYHFTTTTKYVDWNMQLQLRTINLLLDWFPGHSGFRISGGLVFNRNQITAKGNYAGVGNNGITLGGLQFSTFTYQNVTYNVNQIGTLKGKIDFPPVSPYLGIGWGSAPQDQQGWGFTGDLGVLFQGSPTTRITTENCTFAGNACEALATVISVENDRLNDKLKRFRTFPVVRAGISYRF